MNLTLEKAKHLKAGMLDPSLPQLGLTGREMLDLLTLACNGLEAMHAGVPEGQTCPDCSIDDVPCPDCYAAAWTKKHPGKPLRAKDGFPPVVAIPDVC